MWDSNTDDETSEGNISDDLIRLVDMGDVKGVEILLKTGDYDVNYVNDNGDTALDVAANRNDLEMMRLLIEEYNADLNIGLGCEHLKTCAKEYNNKDMMDLIENSCTTKNTIM